MVPSTNGKSNLNENLIVEYGCNLKHELQVIFKLLSQFASLRFSHKLKYYHQITIKRKGEELIFAPN